MRAIRKLLANWPALVIWSMLLIVLAYGRAVSLPFMADDFFEFPFVDRHSLTEILQTAQGLYYYRPLSFVFRKGLYLLLGFHSPLVFHILNLLLHLANGLLVAWLAGRLWPDLDGSNGRNAWPRRYISLTLFLLFPFSYETVPWISAIVHLLVTNLILLSLTCFVRFRESGRVVWPGLGLTFAFLAPFAHETGILVGPFAAVVEATSNSGNDVLWLRVRRVAIWFVPAIIWALIYPTVPTSGGGGDLGFYSLVDIWQNIVYAAQGIGYPITWLGVQINSLFSSGEVIITALLSFVALAGAVAVQVRGGSGRISWLPWLWMGGSLLPAVLFLSFTYLHAAPRTLMLASAGVAWLWADVLIITAAWRPGNRHIRLIGLAAVLIFGLTTVVQSFSYIGRQMKSFEIGGELIDQTVEATVESNAGDQTALFINLPVWLAPPQQAYALGEEGAMLMPAVEKIETLVSVHTGEPSQIEVVRVDGIRTEVVYHSGLIGPGPDWDVLRQEPTRVFVALYKPDRVMIQPAGWFRPGHPPPEPLAYFGNMVTLADAASHMDDHGLQLDLTWRVDGSVPPDITSFVHILDANGRLIAQADGDPFAGAYPFWQWAPGTIAGDTRVIQTDDQARLALIGLYSRNTGERLIATASNGDPLIDQAVEVVINP